VWDAATEPSGIYIYRLVARDFVTVRRSVLLKCQQKLAVNDEPMLTRKEEGAMKRLFMLAVVGLFAVSLSACKKQNPVESGPERYNLISVDGKSLPVVVDSGSGWYEEVLSGRIDLFSDGKVEVTFTWRRVSSTSGTSTGSETERGTYRISGSTITFTFDSGDTYSGTKSGSDITVVEDGQVFLFRK
jgi:hypothetical protein